MTNQPPRATPGTHCPLWKKDVSKVCHTCKFWVQVRGVHPQTNQEIDRWDCAVAWMPLLTIETGRQSAVAAASVDKLRQEVAVANRVGQAMLDHDAWTLGGTDGHIRRLHDQRG